MAEQGRMQGLAEDCYFILVARDDARGLRSCFQGGGQMKLGFTRKSEEREVLKE